MGENMRLWLQLWGIVFGSVLVSVPLAYLILYNPALAITVVGFVLFFGSLAACMLADWLHARR